MKQVTDLLPTSQANSPVLDNSVQRIAQLIGLDELPGPKLNTADSPSVLSNINPLHAIKAKLEVCVGQTEVTVGDLMAAKENDVMVLNRSIEDPVDLLLNGSVVARGLLVASDGFFAIRITELPISLTP